MKTYEEVLNKLQEKLNEIETRKDYDVLNAELATLKWVLNIGD